MLLFMVISLGQSKGSNWQDPVYTTGDQSLAEAMWMGKVGINTVS